MKESKKETSKLLFRVHHNRIIVICVILGMGIKLLCMNTFYSNLNIIHSTIVHLMILFGLYAICFVIYRFIVPEIISDNFVNKFLAKELAKNPELLKKFKEDIELQEKENKDEKN